MKNFSNPEKTEKPSVNLPAEVGSTVAAEPLYVPQAQITPFRSCSRADSKLFSQNKNPCSWRAIPCGFLATWILSASAHAEELIPDDPSIASSLGAWFRDADNTFDTATGIWADSSGNERHAVPVGEVNVNGPITYLAPNLATISSDGLGGNDLSAVHFTSDVDDLLACRNVNGGSSLSELTIFVVFNVNPLAANTSNVRPVGIGSVAATQRGGTNYFNLGSDPSIRKDNGSLGAGQYSLPFPYETTFIRTARMSATAIDEWFNLDGTPQPVINLTGASPFVTSTDDFFIGDLRAGASVIPGVVGATSAQADFDVTQTIVYTSALTDDQVVSVNEWLSNNPSGTGGAGAADDPAITQMTLAEDNSSVTLTWRSKPVKTYAIDLSYNLEEGSWEEIKDSIDSGGSETTTIVPTYSSPEAPEQLPRRAFFRVREEP